MPYLQPPRPHPHPTSRLSRASPPSPFPFFPAGTSRSGRLHPVPASGHSASRVSKGKFAVAAVTLDDYLPMRSTEVKNRTSTDGIKSLRLITAVKTPYLPDGRFDLEAYDSLINTQINGGAEGVIVGGTTGEGHLMSWDEHIMLIGHTVNCFGSNIKVIGNTGSNSTREAVHATEQGFAVGMHAALHVNPYYGKTSTEGLISHFKEVLPMGPTIIYNVPSRTSQDIPPPVIEALSCYSNMAGVKECVGHERVKCYTDKGITIWSGNDDECHDSRWKYGATGVISVASNLVPGLMHSLMFEGENAALNEKLLPLMKWLFCEPNPIGLNTALAQLGVVRPVFRLPYTPLPLEKRVEFVRIVEAIGRENFVGQKEARVLDDDDFVLISRY
ncbi:4-hydroxy-tetrahydrodipicolinate synthase 1, chloroplastic isoform X1 [Triticum urartu]|uniref:4-hydroxy-tetrahydrodipicolinate synthase n=2 Tax=Triticum TaxID=4564 RepID=A0A8R7PKX6_TRIUA|nr:4-hydroxy-tetrahydrodipicolinate synthase 1, chloroplastic isoform X1 [Triticum urartu]